MTIVSPNFAVDYILMDPCERRRLHIKETPKAFPLRYLLIILNYYFLVSSLKPIIQNRCGVQVNYLLELCFCMKDILYSLSFNFNKVSGLGP